MRIERLVPGRAPSADLVGAILTRDTVVAGLRLPKGTRLTPEHLAAVAAAPIGRSVTALVLDAWEVHEDEAALRLARAVGGGRPELELRGPSQSRVDLVATAAGVVELRLDALERLNRIDPLEVFTVFDGTAVEAGELVASCKIAPHYVAEAVLLAGEALGAGRAKGPLVRLRPFRPVRIAALAKGDVSAAARRRFEAAIRGKVTGMGCVDGGIRYVADAPGPVTDALRELLAEAGAEPAIVLTAGGASTDPTDACFVAIEALGGQVVRRGVPSHPGSMLWLARVGEAAIVGLPSCGAYSMATAADLLLPRLVAGQPADAATVARLAHGGILSRGQRFRFPAYARDLDAPDG